MHEIITLKFPTCEHVIVMPRADKRLLSVIGRRMSPGDLKIVQDVFLKAFRDRAKTLSRSELVRSIGESVRVLREDIERLPYMYTFKIVTGPLISSGSGGVGGIRMPGDDSGYYSLRAGLGVCDLKRLVVQEDGTGAVDKVVDCRGRATLATENSGEIVIKRRKMNLSLPSLLQDLHAKLVHQDCADVLLSYKEEPRRSHTKDAI